MSTYTRITKHPQTGDYEKAVHHDDYFGPHMYGVEFPSDKKVYPADLVAKKQVYDFWKADVVAAYFAMADKPAFRGIKTAVDLELDFLNEIQNQYKLRWKRDPIGGEGAIDKSQTLKRNQK